MEEKKPWWKRILEKIGIIKEDVPKLEEPQTEILNEEINKVENTEPQKSSEELFNESLKVEIAPKEPTKEEIIMDNLISRGLDNRLKENPRFVEDILKNVEKAQNEKYPDKELSKTELEYLLNSDFNIDERSGAVSYNNKTRTEGQDISESEFYSIDYQGNYFKTDKTYYIPHEQGKEATGYVVNHTYNNDGIEMEKKEINSKFPEYKMGYNEVDSVVYGNPEMHAESILTSKRQGVDSIQCTFENPRVNYNQALGFIVRLDNREPENISIPQGIIQPLYGAKNMEELRNAQEYVNESDLWYEPERKEDLKVFQTAFAKGIESSKYSKGLTEIAKSKDKAYGDLLEQNKDEDMDM